jgi:hypothetical protein
MENQKTQTTMKTKDVKYCIILTVNGKFYCIAKSGLSSKLEDAITFDHRMVANLAVALVQKDVDEIMQEHPKVSIKVGICEYIL